MKHLKFAAMAALLPVIALALAVCWTPPNANVQPKGNPGLIQRGITVEVVQNPAPVAAIDASQRTLTLKRTDGLTKTYAVSPEVKNFDQIKAGDQVKATVEDDLAIYILQNGRLPDGTTAETLGVNARVLWVDPSYRLLTLQYPNGQSEKFKVELGAKLQEMAPGDEVVAKPKEVTTLHIEKP
jgi:hypothetical protein